MILSVSRRTDIPACYPAWFFARLRAGSVLVRHPMRPHQVAQISLSPDGLDGIVFWTKNVGPMLPYLPLLGSIPYYVQYTFTPYGRDIEAAVPDKAGEGLDAFRQLADAIGPERVRWRVDPILLSPVYTPDVHIDCFARLARQLRQHTTHCTIGFIEPYKNARRNAGQMQWLPCDAADRQRIASAFLQIAKAEGITLHGESLDMPEITPACCIDAGLLGRIGGVPLRARKDKNQRSACGCHESIDIGMYNTCTNGCLYCYANYNAWQIDQNQQAHDPQSPLLIGRPSDQDHTYIRKASSLKDAQLRLFD